MSKGSVSPRIGIIAEDYSDVGSVKILIHRISGNSRIGTKKFIGRGCGKIKRKCNAWAYQLKLKGCSALIVIHDLDNNAIANLYKNIETSLSPCPIEKHLICIPVQELEAWLLSDPDAIKRAMKLKKAPKVKGIPEGINSPKEYLGSIILKASDGEKIYMNTVHNESIATALSISKALHCPSFKPFHHFVKLFCTAST